MENEGNEEEQHAQRRNLLLMRKEIRNLVDPFDVPDALFRKNFRLTKALVRILIRELTPHLKPDNEVLAIPNSVKILTGLNFFATGSYQESIGSSWLLCLARSTVSTFLSEVVEALNNPAIQRKWVRFPHTKGERQKLCEKHQTLFKIPGVLGFVDGTEVTIACPPENMNPQSYWTRKHQYALNCMVMCDSNLIIRHIDAAYPGCLNDAYIFDHSALRRKLMEYFGEDPTFWVLGDSIYGLEPWMQKAILDAAEGSVEEYFTTWHCKGRCCVERCIGVFKGRFRCLTRARALQYHPLKAGKIVKACSVLHNMCRIAGVPDDDVEIIEGEEDALVWAAGEVEAEAMEEDDPDFVRLPGDSFRDVGLRVQRRILDYLTILRAEEAANAVP